MPDDPDSALTDAEWDLVDSAQQKLENDEEVTPEEQAAVDKAIDAGELDCEHSAASET